MLNELKIDELLGKVDSRYGLVLVAARRAREINEYAATLGLNESLGIPGPQVHTRSQHPLSIAFEELRANKLEVSFKRQPEEADEEGVADAAADAAAASGDDFLNPPPGASPAPAADAADAGSSDEGAA
jgi:DNA-directed RNA polymerase subunit omega